MRIPSVSPTRSPLSGSKLTLGPGAGSSSWSPAPPPRCTPSPPAPLPAVPLLSPTLRPLRRARRPRPARPPRGKGLPRAARPFFLRRVPGPAMVQAWYMDESADDPRLPHRGDPCSPVGLEQLRRLGVLYWKVRSAGAGGAVSLPPPPQPRAPRTPEASASGDRGQDRAGGRAAHAPTGGQGSGGRRRPGHATRTG